MSQTSSVKCARCLKPLMKKIGLHCSKCDSTYDLKCVNLSYERYKSFYAPDKQRRDDWSCPECVSKPLKPNNPPNCTAPGPNTGQPGNESGGSVKVDNGHSDMFLEDSKIDLKRFLEEMRAGRKEMSFLRSTISDLMAVITSQNDRIQLLENRIEFLEAKDTGTQNYKISSLEETISHLRAEIEDRNQEMLGNDIEIACLPESGNENATHVVLTIAKKLGVTMDERDVVEAQRIGPPRAPEAGGGAAARPRPLVVRLTRRAQRDALLQAARVRRRLSTDGMDLPSGSSSPFYINERLTRLNRQLHQRVRETAKRLSWKYVWTRDGKIFVRQENGKARHQVRCDGDIVKVFGVNSVSDTV